MAQGHSRQVRPRPQRGGCAKSGLFHAAPLPRRTGKDGYIQIDGGAAVHGQSRGRSIMVNTKGSVYLGEPPEPAASATLS